MACVVCMDQNCTPTEPKANGALMSENHKGIASQSGHQWWNHKVESINNENKINTMNFQYLTRKICHGFRIDSNILQRPGSSSLSWYQEIRARENHVQLPKSLKTSRQDNHKYHAGRSGRRTRLKRGSRTTNVEVTLMFTSWSPSLKCPIGSMPDMIPVLSWSHWSRSSFPPFRFATIFILRLKL